MTDDGIPKIKREIVLYANGSMDGATFWFLLTVCGAFVIMWIMTLGQL